jgi:membrane protease YdiL (CAAX protease family)
MGFAHPEMRQILLLFIFIALALVCGALLSFPLYLLLQIFTDIPFHKVTSQLSSLLGLVFIFLYLKFNNILNRTTAGFNLTQIAIAHEVFNGALLGMVIMFVLIIVFLTLGVHEPEPELDFTLKFVMVMLIKAILAGVMVALIEETLYRGAMLGGLSRTTNMPAAIIASSMIYSAVHFIKYPQVTADAEIGWATGLELLSGAFSRFQDPAIIDSFLALFAFGVLLALVRLNKGNIIQCMGIHAGVVMAIKIIGDMTDYVPGNQYEYMVNRYDHLLGYLAFVWLLLIIAVYYRFFFRSRRQS